MKTAIISGGNGGLGRALAMGLQRDGWHTVLLDINITGLENTAHQTAVELDITNHRALLSTLDTVVQTRPSIDLVIYNAGVSLISPCLDQNDTAHRSLFEINYFAATTMAQALISALRKSRGIHLAISSVAGFSPLYHRTAYAASKHALQGFFTSLRTEEARFGVATCIAAPSFVATNIGNAAKTTNGIVRPGSATDGLDYMSPDEAASIILKAMNRRSAFVPVGRIARASWWINRLSPRLFSWLMMRNMH
jgi:NAD(P)-dependent dehydrogenase (short-subunit alcohol dehydrogenase family)